MERIRGGDAIPTLHAEIIPPQAKAASFSRAARTVDVYPEFASATQPLKGVRAKPPRRGIRRLLWLAVIVALTVIAFLALRAPIVEHLPRTAEIYRAIGIPVAPSGPKLEDISLIRIYSRGAVILNLEGSVANPTGRQIDVPPLSLLVLDANGDALTTIALSPASIRLDPNGSTRFATEIADPPAALASLAIQLGDGPLRPVPID